MIWINHSGPPQPAGARIGTVVINGITWDVWIGNFGWNVISYVSNAPGNTANLDLKPTAVRLKVEQNQLVAGIEQIVLEVGRLKCL